MKNDRGESVLSIATYRHKHSVSIYFNLAKQYPARLLEHCLSDVHTIKSRFSVVIQRDLVDINIFFSLLTW